MIDTADNFGKRLVFARKNRKLSQMKLAELVDCSVGSISRFENSDEPDGVSTTILLRICKVLGCNMIWLATGLGEAPKELTFPLAAIIGAVDVDESVKVLSPTHMGNCRFILVAEDGYPCSVGDVLMVDTEQKPDVGDDFAAMTKGGMLYARMVSMLGNIRNYQAFDGRRGTLDMGSVAWMGPVTGTLVGKRALVS